MSRRNNRKLTKAHHDAMLVEENSGIKKKRSKAQKKEKRKKRDKIEAVLCNVFTSVAVGKETKNAVPIVGAPLSFGAAGSSDVTMTPMKKKKKRKPNRKLLRRSQKIRDRKSNRSAMIM